MSLKKNDEVKKFEFKNNVDSGLITRLNIEDID